MSCSSTCAISSKVATPSFGLVFLTARPQRGGHVLEVSVSEINWEFILAVVLVVFVVHVVYWLSD